MNPEGHNSMEISKLEQTVKKLSQKEFEKIAVKYYRGLIKEREMILGKIDARSDDSMDYKMFKKQHQEIKEELKLIGVWEKEYDREYDLALKGDYER